MASQSVARSESIAVFIPELEPRITEAMGHRCGYGNAFTDAGRMGRAAQAHRTECRRWVSLKGRARNPWLAGSARCVLRDDRFRGLLRMRNSLNAIKASSSS